MFFGNIKETLINVTVLVKPSVAVTVVKIDFEIFLFRFVILAGHCQILLIITLSYKCVLGVLSRQLIEAKKTGNVTH